MRGKKDILKSSRNLRKKRLIKKSVFYSLVSLVFLAGLVGFFHISYFRIKKISIEGNITLKTEDLMAKVSNYLNAKQFKILPHDNILIFSKKELVGNILENFGRIRNIVLNKDFPDAVSIKVEERNNEALFCSEAEKCFFLDENGFAFEQAPYFSAGVYLTFFDERENGSDASTWKRRFQNFQEQGLLPQEQFKKLIDFKSLLDSENVKITDIIIKKEGIYQLNTAGNWHILLNEQNDARTSFENLKITLGQIADQRKNLSYIDLRFGNKVFYKFR